VDVEEKEEEGKVEWSPTTERKRRRIQARLAVDAEEEEEEGKVEWSPILTATASYCDLREESADCCCNSNKRGRGCCNPTLREV
jgi:hypothetical protein